MPPVGWLWNVATYPVMGEPPSDTGAVHETVADPGAPLATTDVGAPATVRGVPETGTDAVPAPMAFRARTATVYSCPFVRPVIARGLASAPASSQAPPFSWYSSAVIGEPPSESRV